MIMAAFKRPMGLVSVIILSFLFLVHASTGTSNPSILKSCKFSAIYQLGDSISDTGNVVKDDPSSVCTRLPYGSSINHPGRCSDGLLIIDFIAGSAGIPFLEPYLKLNRTFKRCSGVNFAVAGSTAQPADILPRKNITTASTNKSLDVQLGWMSSYFNGAHYHGIECKKNLQSALFFVGEIGINDYFYPFSEGQTIKKIMSSVPDVVQAIKAVAKGVIGLGARKIIVAGNFPLGCFPYFFNNFHSNGRNSYDKLNCVKELNELAIYHNKKVQQAIQELQKEHPNVIVVYGDYYNAFLGVLRNAPKFGFSGKQTQKQCCGNSALRCGTSGAPICPNPSKYISWDGLHLTQQTHKYMARWLIRQIFPKLQCFA